MSELGKINVQDLTPENIYQYINELNIYGYIYRIRNNINGKTYIGLRKINKDYTWNTYWGSGTLIKQSISKYGRENFTKELVDIATNFDELSAIEVFYIKLEKFEGKGEYNLLVGKWNAQNNQPSEERINAVNLARSKSLKAASYKNYLRKIDGKEQLIIDTYLNLKNIRKTSKELNIGVKIITKFLKENNIELNYQNVYGNIITEGKKENIKNVTLSHAKIFTKLCLLDTCDNEFTTTDKSNNYCSISCKNISINNKNNKVKISKKKRTIYFNYCLYNKCDNYYSSTRKNDKYCSNDCKLAAAKTRKPGNSIILPDDPDIIRKLYWDDELSATKIAEQYNCNEQTIRNYMKEHDISIRTFKESSRISHKPGSQERIDISCLNCQEIFHISNFNKHYDYCVNRRRCLEDNCNNFLNKKNKNGYCIKHRKVVINICAHDSCDKELSKKEAKYCRDHMVITHSYKNCENCGKEVIASNFKRHYDYCINATICAKNKCKLPTKNSRSKYCWKH